MTRQGAANSLTRGSYTGSGDTTGDCRVIDWYPPQY
jgi:hypothetical protein